MKHTLFFVTTAFFCWVALGCQDSKDKASTQTTSDSTQLAGSTATMPSAPTLAGDYAQPDYAQRQKGYDWVGVRVSALDDSTLRISVRSRADHKKPTCTFDAKAQRTSALVYVSQADGFRVVYTFSNNGLSISPGEGMDKNALQYFCSGGGNFQGTYQKLAEPLDETQIDPRVFVKALNWQNYFFDISTTGAGSLSQLKIESYGWAKGKQVKQVLQQDADGQVMGAETEDMNGDGYPELLVYVQSAGSGSYGQVIAYSLQKGKTLVPIDFPPLEQSAEAAKGYGGHDAFALVEQSLVRRFPTYTTTDTQAQPTGLMRQIQYKLVQGKKGPAFEVVRIASFPSP